MFAIANGRKALWQWDLNQQLTVAGSCTEVHYLDKGALSTLTVAVKDGKADIPNVLLQRPGRLVVYAYIVDAQDHHTKICETFGISARPKPDDYVYTETEVKTWSNLKSQIGDLADLETEAKENLVAAINEAVRSGGGAGAWYVTLTQNDDGSITADKTINEIEAAYQAGYAVYCIYLYFTITATVPIIAPLTIHRENTQYTFCGVGTMDKLYSFQFELTESGWTVLQKEIPQKSDIPAAYILPKATANALGGVKADSAEAADTQPVRIGEDGKLYTEAGGTDISLGLTSAAVGQTIKVKAIDESGKPTEWEAADMSGGVSLDTTLTQSGKAADAKAVGDALAEKADISDIPTALPNPNALTFTGAVTGSYDGSAPLTVNIPAGGGGGGSSDKWELINTITVSDDATTNVTFTQDSAGNPFALKKLYLKISGIKGGSTYPIIRLNGLNWKEQFGGIVIGANDNMTISVLFELLGNGIYIWEWANPHSRDIRRTGERVPGGGTQSLIETINSVMWLWGSNSAITNGSVFTLYGVRA